MKNALMKVGSFFSEMKYKFLAVMTLCMVTVMAHAEDAETDYKVDDLWNKLGLQFDKFFEQVFEAMKLPVGTILAVVFVMALFYFCVKMAKSAINKRNSI